MSMPQRATNRDRVQDQRSSVLESLEPRVLLSVSAWPMLGHDALGSRVLADASTTQVGNSAPISIFNSGFGYTSVLTGDVNADGLPEAVLRRNDRIDIIGGDGAVQTSFPVDGVRLDMLADLDGDGQMDIFVSDNAGDGTLRIRVFDDTGDLLGQFTKPTPTANATMYAQSLVDLNLDGKLELVAALNGWMTNFRGVAVFDAATGVELAASEVGPIVQSVCVANVSGDSKLEIVAGSVGVCNSVTGLDGSVDSASYVWAWDATATAQWRSGPLNSGGYYDSAVMPADLNQDQDGQMDLVVTASSHGESLWTATVGRIGLLDPTTHAMISGSIRDFGGPVEVQAVADLQPGGTQEVLVVHEDRASQTFFLRELSGSDGFADLYTHGFGGQRPTVQAVNDLNGDGKDEILVSAGTTLYCLRRDLTVLWQWSRPNDPTRPEQPILSAIVTDMTEDGINDVLVTSGNSEANSRVDLLSLTPDLAWGEPGFDLANDRFVPQASASSDGNAYAVAQTEEGYSTVFTGDVNADGKVEIVLGNGTDVVILLAGRGQLAQGQTGAQGSLEGDVQLTGVGALDLVQDVTGDGVPEVIVSDRLGSAVRLRAYDGAGNLVRTFTMAATGDSTITAQGVADLNQDDTLELVASVDSSGVSGQRGVVVFDALTGAQIGYYDVGPSVQAVSIGSVGGDSKMEIVFAGRGQASGARAPTGRATPVRTSGGSMRKAGASGGQGRWIAEWREIHTFSCRT